MIFDFYSDPGHGWVKVKISLLQRLGIADNISPYSYRHGEWAYLEEDRDLSVFHAAATNQGLTVRWREHIARQRMSKIRSYSPYYI